MKFRPNSKRATLATTFLFITTGLQVVSVISAVLQWLLLKDIKNGSNVTTEAISANDMREGIIGIVLTIVYIATIVVFIQWFRRAYFNLHLRASGLRYSEGWAAGAWFIPVFNLFGPYRIFNDLISKSKEVLQKNGITERIELSMNQLNAYWLFWVVGNIIANVSFRKAMKQNIDDLLVATTTDIISSVFSIVAGILLISIIQKYNQVEPLLENMKSEIDSIGEGD
jgi:hypothetical protein